MQLTYQNLLVNMWDKIEHCERVERELGEAMDDWRLSHPMQRIDFETLPESKWGCVTINRVYLSQFASLNISIAEYIDRAFKGYCASKNLESVCIWILLADNANGRN